MVRSNMVHEVNNRNLTGDDYMNRNETRTKINFYITKSEYQRFKDTCRNQDVTMSVLLRNMIKKANKTLEENLI